MPVDDFLDEYINRLGDNLDDPKVASGQSKGARKPPESTSGASGRVVSLVPASLLVRPLSEHLPVPLSDMGD